MYAELYAAARNVAQGSTSSFISDAQDEPKMLHFKVHFGFVTRMKLEIEANFTRYLGRK